MKLRVPHFRQETSYTCIPACVRMVLAYHGKQYTERELAAAFQTVPLIGTLPENVVSALDSWGYQVRWFERGTIQQLSQIIAQKLPVIIFARAADLPHGSGGFHALVVIKIDSRSVVLLDPTVDKELKFTIQRFTEIWTNFGNEGIVIF